MLLNLPTKRRPKSKATRADLLSATRLHDAVVKIGNRRSWSHSAWSKEFATLRSEVGQTRIDAALGWYAKHMTGEYAIQAWCGKSFRAKFDKIEAAMKRSTNKDVEPSQESQRIASDLEYGYAWPGNSSKELPAAVEISMRNMRKFMKTLRKLRDRNDRGFAYFLYGTWLNAEMFVRAWFRDIAPWAVKKDVKTLFPAFIVSVESKRFRELGMSVAAKYGNTSNWDKLMKEINK